MSELVIDEESKSDVKNHSGISKSHIRIGTGLVMAKKLDYNQENLFDNMKNQKQAMRITNIRHNLKSSKQREIHCKFCQQVYNILNKPLIVEKCACGGVHQLCESCF